MEVSENFIIYPVHLFQDIDLLKKYQNIYLYEHPIYFQSNFNPLKLVFQRATMQYYFNYLKKKFKTKVKYINFDTKLDIANFDCYDPVEKEIKIPKDSIVYDTPIFILSNQEVFNYIKSKKGKMTQTGFYSFMRKKTNILMNKGKPEGNRLTYDVFNRQKLPKDTIIPEIPKLKKNKYITEAKKYIFSKFNKKVEDNIIFPTTFEESEKWLEIFINQRLFDFGKYQDAIVPDDILLFHSGISMVLNIGFLLPMDVINKVVEYQNVNIESKEGFIRQILGWREFCRLQYHLIDYNSNYFKNDRKLSKVWYSGDTGIIPVDNSIIKAFKYGYLHHIERLMIMGNIMLLSFIDPKEVYRWFMEFSLDSYNWVMAYNIFSMSQYADGGRTTSKPYFSSSNYILKMSNYTRSTWCDTWDALYWNFIDKHKDKIKKNGRLAFQVTFWNKKSLSEKKKIKETAKEFINKMTE